MADEPLSAWPATRMLAAFRAGEVSPVDVLESAIARIARHDGLLNAVVTPMFEQAAADAALAQERWYRGAPRPLEGVPVLVKDLLDTAGTRTTYGSPMFDAHVPTVDAAAVDRLRGCGAIVLAKTATHEFGWGITTASEHYGPTRNPWATDRSPGGSSGGSAAGLAAGYAPLALGTDTAGSIRIPAAFCGIAGLKPTFGAVGTGGLRTFVPSLDHIGPMARSVDDLALLWSVLGDRPAPPVPTRTGKPVVGVLTGRPGPELAPAVRSGCAAVAAALAGSGCRVVEVDGRELGAALDALATTVLAEGIATHRRAGLWPGRAAEYGPDVRARLEHAERLDPDGIADARAGRTTVRAAMDALFTQVDVLLSPVSTIGPGPVDAVPADHRERVMTDIAPQSLAGLPAIALRAGFDDDGLPVGVQLSAPAGHEGLLLDLGRSLERATPETQARKPDF